MINLDASFLATNRQGGWGCIAQDMLGDVLFAAAGPLANLSTATHAEALALMKAINLVESFGMGRVMFMMDCLPLKQAMEANLSDRSQLGCLFRESKYLLQMGFIEYKILFECCSCNKPAHLLAGRGVRMGIGSDHVWLTSLPLDVMGAMANDLVEPTS